MKRNELDTLFDKMPTLSPEEDALLLLIQGTLDQIEEEGHIDRTTAFAATLEYMRQNRAPDGNDDMKRVAVLLLNLLFRLREEEKPHRIDDVADDFKPRETIHKGDVEQ